MSLKAFHIVFVSASILVCLMLGGWAVNEYRSLPRDQYLLLAVGSFLAAVGLAAYGKYFLRKLKHISYL